MKLTVTCQSCGKLLSVVEKDQISQEDIEQYRTSSYCDTVKGTAEVDDGMGGTMTILVSDGQDDIQITKTEK